MTPRRIVDQIASVWISRRCCDAGHAVCRRTLAAFLDQYSAESRATKNIRKEGFRRRGFARLAHNGAPAQFRFARAMMHTRKGPRNFSRSDRGFGSFSPTHTGQTRRGRPKRSPASSDTEVLLKNWRRALSPVAGFDRRKCVSMGMAVAAIIPAILTDFCGWKVARVILGSR